MKIGDKVKIKVGVYAGKESEITVISDAKKPIGVGGVAGIVGMLTWFKEDEVELKIK